MVTMVLAEITVTTLPVIISLVIVAAATFLLVLCVCGKKRAQEEPELTGVQVKDSTVADQPENGFVQGGGQASTESVKLDVDTAVTALNMSRSSQNSTSNHSRGNSLDLNHSARQSGASAGSSPRPTTLSRELPDIPRWEHTHHEDRKSHAHGHHDDKKSHAHGHHDDKKSHAHGHHDDKKSHTHLPELPSPALRNNVTAPVDKNTHSHAQLPLVHKSQASGASGKDTGSPGKNRNGLVKPDSNNGSPVVSRPEAKSELDDYDHIVEKKSRPRSDYDHILIEGEKKLIIARKLKTTDEDDYSEVTDVKTENIYEGVPEEPGGMVIPSEVRRKPDQAKAGRAVKDDPYNTIELNDPPYNKIPDTEPPYNRIKEEREAADTDPPYNRIKDDVEKGVELFIDEIDPYDAVKDDASGERSSVRRQKLTRKTPPLIDPYSLMDEERNVSNQTDPYSRVLDSELEDPYNRLVDDDTDSGRVAVTPTPVNYSDNDYATVNKTGEVEYAKVNKPSIRDRHRNAGAVSDLDTVGAVDNHGNVGASGNIPSSSAREEIIHDEYATVVKVRKLSTGQTSSGGTSGASPESGPDLEPFDLTPPEPPRGYEQDGGGDTDHYNTVAMVAGDSASSDQLGPTGKKKEPPYNKLSVRESLASMNARSALNTYEYVADVDNLYATVDGSSGDGVVTRAPPQPGNTGVNGGGSETREPRVTSELYAEIDGASAPAPPSLDSLHETAKHHQEEFRRKVDVRPHELDYYNLKDSPGQGQIVKGHSRTPSEQSQGHLSYHSGQGHFRTPSSDAMNLSFEGRATLAMEENVDLDQDQSSRVVTDQGAANPGLELDPNYETVEEARSKVKYEEINGARPKQPPTRPHIYEEADNDVKYEVVKDNPKADTGKIRAHVYEEVTVPNEARRTRQRVLNQHTYEEVTDIKVKGQKSGKGQVEDHSSPDVKKKKKGHERNSPGDQQLNSRKKGGDGKEKGKEGKRKSEGKDGNKK